MWIKFDTQDLKRHDIEVLRSLLTEAEKGLDYVEINRSKEPSSELAFMQKWTKDMSEFLETVDAKLKPLQDAFEAEDHVELVAMDPSIRFREPEEIEEEAEVDKTIYPVWLPAESAPTWIDPVELDTQGIPWCAGIHSRTKAKTKKGVWRSKRSQPTAQEFKVPEESSPTWELADGTPDPTEVYKNIEGGMETGTCTVSLPEPPLTFEELTKQITSMISAGQIGTVEVMNVIQETGLNFLPDLQTRPDLIPVVNNKLLRLTEMSE